MIWADKISWYREAFQKIIDGAEAGWSWQNAYRIFAKAWNGVSQGGTLPEKINGQDSVFAIYNIRPKTQEALEGKLGGIVLKIKPPETISEPSLWNELQWEGDKMEGGEQDDGIPDLTQTVIWTQWATTTATEWVLSTPKSEIELKMFEEFEEFFLEQFGPEGNAYLPRIDEVGINIRNRTIIITQAYRVRMMRRYFKNEILKERILSAIIDFRWKK